MKKKFEELPKRMTIGHIERKFKITYDAARTMYSFCTAAKLDVEWAYVEDELPEKGEKVIVYGRPHRLQNEPLSCILARLDPKCGWIADNTLADFLYVTHWMGLPSIPTGDPKKLGPIGPSTELLSKKLTEDELHTMGLTNFKW